MYVVNNFNCRGFGPLLEDKLCLIFKLAPSVCRMTFPILSSLLVRLLVLSPLFPYTTLFRSLTDVRTLRVLAEDTDLTVGVGGRTWVASKGLRNFPDGERSEEHTSELQSQSNIVCRLLLEKKMPHDLSHLGFLAGQIGRLITI